MVNYYPPLALANGYLVLLLWSGGRSRLGRAETLSLIAEVGGPAQGLVIEDCLGRLHDVGEDTNVVNDPGPNVFGDEIDGPVLVPTRRDVLNDRQSFVTVLHQDDMVLAVIDKKLVGGAAPILWLLTRTMAPGGLDTTTKRRSTHPVIRPVHRKMQTDITPSRNLLFMIVTWKKG